LPDVRRLVIDTNVYVDWLNGGRHEDVLFEAGAVKYLSAVVLMELRAGAFRASDRRTVGRIQAAFERAGRLLVPSAGVYGDAGETLRRLQAEKGYGLAASHSIVNDVLIALSARAAGAVVVTQNERDFRAIRSVRSFRLEIVPNS
jgi:predicted nucleic acid-binding protein